MAAYPGPLLGRCTNLYAAYHAWRGTLHIDMYRCHQKYGPIVRYSPSRLLINSSTAAREISSHGANVIKSKAYQALVHSAPNTLTIRNREDHARRRRILSLAFSDAQLRAYEAILLRHIDTLCLNLTDNARSQASASGSEALDMAHQFDYFTFDVMSEVIFGMKYNALREPKYRFVMKALEESNVRISALVQASSLALGRIDKYLFSGSIKSRNKFLGFLAGLLKNRSKASFSDNGNVFSYLETAKDPDGESTLSKSEIRAESATLVVAGSDTSSTTLAATLFYLSGKPKAYAKLCHEIRSTFESDDDIRLGAKLTSCTYLRACIDEALRMSPPVGGALWREIRPGGMTIGSLVLPEGIDVGTGIYSLHHHEDYFESPFNYKPERWLVGEDGSTKESVEMPGDRCWPSDKEWGRFNSSISGQLVRTTPPAAPCYAGPSRDASACEAVTQGWTTSSFQASQPIGYDYPLNTSCPLTQSTANAPSANCSIGNSPVYAVNVTDEEDISKAIQFASKNNIRVVIKSTGHDFLQRSTGYGSLSIWLQNYRRGFNFHDDFQVVNECPKSDWKGSALTITGAYSWSEIYPTAFEKNLIAVGGNNRGPCSTGGWTQGGGHSPVTRYYGLGADQVLSAKVVLASGELVTASPCNNTDLFYAIRGGGGGTYGVVTQMTVKTYPTKNIDVIDVVIGIGSTNANTSSRFLDAMTDIYSAYPYLSEVGFAGYGAWAMNSPVPVGGNFTTIFTQSFTTLGNDAAETTRLFKPLADKLMPLKDAGFTVSITQKAFTDYGSYYGNKTGTDATVGTVSALASRLLGKSALEGDRAHLRKAMETMAGTNGSAVFHTIVHHGLETAPETRDTSAAVQPGWYDAVILDIFERPVLNEARYVDRSPFTVLIVMCSLGVQLVEGIEACLGNFLLLCAAYVVGKVLYQIVYYRFFHPLAKFPGPFWGSVTRLWITYHNIKQDECQVNQALHRKYGPVIRITPTMLLVSDATKLPDIYHRNANKSQHYITGSFGSTESLFNMQDHVVHARFRKIAAAPYAFSNIRKMEPLLDLHIERWIQRLDSNFASTGKRFDFAPWAVYLVYDIVSDVGFGQPFGFIEQEKDVEGLIQGFHDGLVPFGIMARCWPFTNWMKSTFLGKYMVASPEQDSGIGTLMRFRDRLIAQRFEDIEKGNTNGRIDLLQTFIEARDEKGEPLDLDYIKAEILLVLLAGADTTGTAFQAFMMYIVTTPGVYERLMGEIDRQTRVGNLSNIAQYAEVQQYCPYYTACIRETMRLTPSAPNIFPRIARKGGLELFGKHVPEGTEVTCNPWLVHRDEAIFGPDAEVFRPERWLESEEKTKEMLKYNMGFGYGARVCLGRDLAMMELSKGPLQFLRTFKPEVLNKDQPGKYVIKGGVSFFEDMWMTVGQRPKVI
ncbi:hypothetical protein CkaCkLH20_08800 [Colletotrichum karsti]|uniref:FAD-binding PCMH-type domain-containing protein n=1 Tax=Colletotrichum karsti TaxID=1095194 RepID=A0A9P6LIG7_9PEZI|nr:uncharacterized protein CkaCkLH20_08800 [Colletotrichum karsti]KAF9873690.1 hypothetical protein CkaCkLH20_08800 [Colletotrichum karsti]